MMNYYHVSRVKLSEDVTQLVPDYYNRLVTHGLAEEHFEQYWKEIVFEKVRRIQYSTRVSRLSCVYLVDSLESAREYKKSHEYAREGTIYEVEPLNNARVDRADMNLVNCNGFPLDSIFAHAAAYHSELHTDTPFWEYLCGGNVKIIKEV